jgi:photosystem II stability/assembly factor-like uncharacterized protein
LKTVNGGKSWTTYKVPGADSLDFRDIHAFDKQTAVAMSAGLAEADKAKIYRTEDGGDPGCLCTKLHKMGFFWMESTFGIVTKGICMGDPVQGKLFILTTQKTVEKAGRNYRSKSARLRNPVKPLLLQAVPLFLQRKK